MNRSDLAIHTDKHLHPEVPFIAFGCLTLMHAHPKKANNAIDKQDRAIGNLLQEVQLAA